MRDETTDDPLDGIELTDVRTGAAVDLAGLRGVHVVTLIRHRF